MNQRRWGCEGNASEPMEMDGVIITTCPRRWIKDEPELATDCFWFYRRYDTGMLPEDGGLHSQPNKLMQVFRVMEAAFNKVEKEKDARDDRKRAVGRNAAPPRNPYVQRVSPDGKAFR